MRTTISLDPSLAQLARRAAKTERRNFSNLVEVALASYIGANGGHAPVAEAAAELKQLGACPVMALRDKIAEVTRDQFLSHETQSHPHDEKQNLCPPAPLPGADRRHPPASVRVVALRTPARPPLCVGAHAPRRP